MLEHPYLGKRSLIYKPYVKFVLLVSFGRTYFSTQDSLSSHLDAGCKACVLCSVIDYNVFVSEYVEKVSVC